MRDLTKAILSLYPEAKWSLNGDSYSGLEWLSTDIPKPTQEQLEAEVDRIEQEWSNTEYQRLRESQYPSFADQFDLLYHGGYDAWKQSIQAVKDKYPKGN